MNSLHVAVLFHSSLFAAGIASRLAEAGFASVSLLDVNQFDSSEKVQAQHPNIVIYDSSDPSVTENLCFSILRGIPGIYLLQVDYAREEVQIYSSQQKVTHEMGEFISLMQNIKVSMD